MVEENSPGKLACEDVGEKPMIGRKAVLTGENRDWYLRLSFAPKNAQNQPSAWDSFTLQNHSPNFAIFIFNIYCHNLSPKNYFNERGSFSFLLLFYFVRVLYNLMNLLMMMSLVILARMSHKNRHECDNMLLSRYSVWMGSDNSNSLGFGLDFLSASIDLDHFVGYRTWCCQSETGHHDWN